LGNVIFSFITFIPFLLILFIIIFGIGVVRRMERRAEERLKLDKENAALQQQQIQEINNRLTNIEKILKEVD
jgi:large-conductance mechanosensitive channel